MNTFKMIGVAGVGFVVLEGIDVFVTLCHH
jgi:hypothetical protein